MSDSSGSTERRFVHSTAASYFSLGVRLVIKFGTRFVLARLILPEGHGLYELALRIVIIAAAARDLGLPFHLMRDERKPYGTVLAFSLVQGALVTGLVVLAAPLAAGLNPELPLVLRVFSLWIVLDAVVNVPKIYFERELRIGRMVMPEIARGLAVAVVSIALAWQGWGVWSFVIGDLIAYLLFAALVWRRAWGAMPRAADFSLLADLLRRSYGLFAVWIVLQLVTYIDVFVVELFSSTAMVGQYVRAYELAFLTRQIVFPRALLPALVEYRDEARRFEQAFRLGTVFMLAFEVTAGYFLFFNAEAVVGIAYGANWDPAIPILQVLAFVPFLDIFTELGGEVLKVRHEDRLWLVIALMNLISLVGFGALFTSRWGALGMAFANFLLLGNLLMAWRLRSVFGTGFRRLARDLLWVYLVPLGCFVPVVTLLSPGWWRLGLSSVSAVAALALLAWRFHGPFRVFLAAERE